MRDSFNLNDREVAIATRAQPEFERICDLKRRLRRDGYDYQRLHIRRLVEAGILETRKESYRTFSVRRGPKEWDGFFGREGLGDTRRGLVQLAVQEEVRRTLWPLMDAAFNPNVLPFRRPRQGA